MRGWLIDAPASPDPSATRQKLGRVENTLKVSPGDFPVGSTLKHGHPPLLEQKSGAKVLRLRGLGGSRYFSITLSLPFHTGCYVVGGMTGPQRMSAPDDFLPCPHHRPEPSGAVRPQGLARSHNAVEG